nr:ulp1 protease family, C-terminal catalytic domain-containing protein [Tanacetum cinerariifolium]
GAVAGEAAIVDRRNDSGRLILPGIYDFNGPFIKEWLSQFGDKNEVRPNDITDVIVSIKNAGKLFKMNFLMLFANTMGLCEKSGVCNMNILKKITDDVCVEKIDWLSLRS